VLERTNWQELTVILYRLLRKGSPTSLVAWCDGPVRLGNMYELYLKWRSNDISDVEEERRKKESYHTGTVKLVL
jgi:hypothetical protein